MELYLQRRSPAGNFAGLAIGLALLYGLARHDVRIFTPPDVAYISPDIVKPSQPTVKPPKISSKLPALPTIPLPEFPPPVVEQTTATASIDASPSPPVTGPVLIEPASAPGNALGIACPNAQSIRSAVNYPVQARLDGLQGDVLARFIVGAAGDIRNVQIIRSSNRVFNAPVLAAVKQLNCVAQGQDVAVEMPFWFRLE